MSKSVFGILSLLIVWGCSTVAVVMLNIPQIFVATVIATVITSITAINLN